MSESAESLQGVRAAIDAIDQQLLELLRRRQGLVEQAGRLKTGQGTDAVIAADRVVQVIRTRREDAAALGLDPDVAEQIWRAMIDAFTRLELCVHVDGRGSPAPSEAPF